MAFIVCYLFDLQSSDPVFFLKTLERLGVLLQALHPENNNKLVIDDPLQGVGNTSNDIIAGDGR